MATGTFYIPTGAAITDPTSGCQIVMENNFPVLAFDDTTDETCYVPLIAPSDYASAPVLKMRAKMASTQTGVKNVGFRVEVWAFGDAEAIGSTSYDTVNSDTTALSSGIAADTTFLIEISLTNADSLAARESIRLKITRDADQTSTTDDAVGDCEVTDLWLEYTTT